MGKVSQYLQQLAADRAAELQFPGVGENRSPIAKRDYGGGSVIFQPKLFAAALPDFSTRKPVPFTGHLVGTSRWQLYENLPRLQKLQGFV